MDRIDVINAVLKATGAITYVEIGVRYGTVFMSIRAKRKIAIDPQFAIPLWKRFAYPQNFFHSKFFEVTSDAFFDQHAAMFDGAPIDVAFIDGLHTYGQSLKDVENCLRFLSPTGVIVMHDCSPPSAAATLPTLEEAIRVPGNNAWCGDVWKTIVRVRSSHSDLSACVLDCDYGVGIITRERNTDRLSLTPDQISGLTYADMDRERLRYLNLKSPEHLDEICHRLRIAATAHADHGQSLAGSGRAP